MFCMYRSVISYDREGTRFEGTFCHRGDTCADHLPHASSWVDGGADWGHAVEGHECIAHLPLALPPHSPHSPQNHPHPLVPTNHRHRHPPGDQSMPLGTSNHGDLHNLGNIVSSPHSTTALVLTSSLPNYSILTHSLGSQLKK